MNYLNDFATSENLVSVVLIIVICLLITNYFNKKKYKLPPGPTGIPVLGYISCAGRNSHKILYNLKEKYGNIIGFYFGQQYNVVLNEYNIMKETLSHPSCSDRENVFGSIPLGFAVFNGDEWAEQRRFSIHTIRDLGLGRKNQETVIRDYAEDLTQIIDKTDGKPFEISETLQNNIMSNIASFTIGRKLDVNQEVDKINLLKRINHIFNIEPQVFDIKSAIPGFRTISSLFGNQELENIISSYRAFLKDEIKKHNFDKGQDEDGKDFIYLYLQKIQDSMSQNSKHFFNEENLLGNLSVIFIGGSDTTTTSINWLLRLMAKHPEIQSKIHDEIDSTIGKEASLSFADRYRLPFTFATVLEVMRFVTVAPLIAPRIARNDFVIRGYTIPKGTQVHANLWAIHNDPTFWKNPELFKPERFLEEGKVNDNLPSFGPFSYGKRRCPGGTIALTMTFLYCTKLLQNFKVQVPPGVKVQTKSVEGFLNTLESQELCFHRRTS